MPAVSEKQRRAMWAAAEGHSTLGIPEKVGREFVGADNESSGTALNTNAFGSGLTELDVAKAIRDGTLTSPQPYENVHLFDVRVTGTGTSYRQALDEYVYRPPEHFLSDDFVQRCNGLPLVFEHPDRGILNTEEYRDRAIGTVILPYIKGDEVWGIAKVFDEDAAKLMRSSHASTSPAVVFRDAGSTKAVELDGDTVLIEGKPSYLDHLAICEAGVWDKGGSPSGVNNSTEESAMADENQAPERAAETAPAWVDSLHSKLDAVCSRLDALEGREHEEHKPEGRAEKREDDSKEGAEKAGEKEEKHEEEAIRALEHAKREGEDEKRETERLDSQKINRELQAKLAAMEAKVSTLSRLPSNEERDAIASAYARADALARMLADEVTHALPGESSVAYRKRLAAKFQKFSPTLKSVKLDSIDGPAFDLLESQIYSDAQAAALSPEVTSSGRLIPIITADASGRRVTSYAGDIKGWMGQFESGPTPVRVNHDLVTYSASRERA